MCFSSNTFILLICNLWATKRKYACTIRIMAMVKRRELFRNFAYPVAGAQAGAWRQEHISIRQLCKSGFFIVLFPVINRR